MSQRGRCGLFAGVVAVIILTLSFFVPGTRAETGEKEPIRFAVIGDSGTGHASQWQVAKAMGALRRQLPFGFVLMLGDNIYGGAKNQTSLVKRFEEPYSDLLAEGVNFYAALGNHGSSLIECRYDKFNMNGCHYYSFIKGDSLVQFFALDSTVMDAKQLEWFEKELKASVATWKIAFFHHPIYSSGKTHGGDPKLRSKLEPLFAKFRVNVVLSGHDHFYERLKPQNGVVYFVSGAAGKLRRGNINRKDPLMAAGNDEECHFVLFDVRRDRIAFRAIGQSGEEIDSGVISDRPATR